MVGRSVSHTHPIDFSYVGYSDWGVLEGKIHGGTCESAAG